MKRRRLYVAILMLAVALAGVSGYVIYRRSLTPKSRLYTSDFCILFKDESNNLLAKLTGELSITEPSKGTIHPICKLSFSSEQGGSSIERIELFTSWMCLIYEGPQPIYIPAPLSRKVTLYAGEEITLFECSRDISSFKEPMIVFGFSQGTRIGHHEWGNLTLPTIRIYFSDGRRWQWEYEYGTTLPFPLWSGIRDWRLSELSGRSEATTITLTVDSER